MNAYQHILYAADFSEETLQVGARAKEIAQHYEARLSPVHVIEQVTVSTGYDLLSPLPELPDDTLLQAAGEALQRLAERLEITNAGQRVVMAVSTRECILETTLCPPGMP